MCCASQPAVYQRQKLNLITQTFMSAQQRRHGWQQGKDSQEGNLCSHHTVWTSLKAASLVRRVPGRCSVTCPRRHCKHSKPSRTRTDTTLVFRRLSGIISARSFVLPDLLLISTTHDPRGRSCRFSESRPDSRMRLCLRHLADITLICDRCHRIPARSVAT
jgi:hypothetical protein